MNAEEFVSQLRGCAPSVAALRGVGLSETEALAFRTSFELQPRRQPELVVEELGEVGRLLRVYNAQNVVVGPFRFAPRISEVLGGWIIGDVEADPMVVDGATGEVRVVDLASPTTTLWHVASSCDSLLAALAVAACFLGRRAVEEGASDGRTSESALSECTIVAGGAKYRKFYEMVLGT